MKPLYGFGGKRIEPVGVITLLVSFSTMKNPHTEYITFDVVDMPYPYNAIFGSGLLNTFEVALHLGYLCLKIPATFGIIMVFGSQQDARNIEKSFAPGDKNVHFTREESEQHNTSTRYCKEEALVQYKKAIEAEGEFKKIPLDPSVPDRTVCIGTKVSQQEQAELLAFLDKNNDVFAWSTSDLVGVSIDVIKHQPQVNPSAKPKKQKLSKMFEEKVEAAKAEVQRLLDAGFIREVAYPQWQANVVMVRMVNGECVLILQT
jgi:ubiquitin